MTEYGLQRSEYQNILREYLIKNKGIQNKEYGKSNEKK